MTLFVVCLVVFPLAAAILVMRFSEQNRNRARNAVNAALLTALAVVIITAFVAPGFLAGMGIRLFAELLPLVILGLLAMWVLSHFRRPAKKS